MLNYNTIAALVSHMFESIDTEDSLVSVIADNEMSIEILNELLSYKNVILNSCEFDFDEEYDREYIVSLLNDVDSGNWYATIERSYLPDNDRLTNRKVKFSDNNSSEHGGTMIVTMSFDAFHPSDDKKVAVKDGQKIWFCNYNSSATPLPHGPPPSDETTYLWAVISGKKSGEWIQSYLYRHVCR